jgi:hypothetical protein
VSVNGVQLKRIRGGAYVTADGRFEVRRERHAAECWARPGCRGHRIVAVAWYVWDVAEGQYLSSENTSKGDAVRTLARHLVGEAKLRGPADQSPSGGEGAGE